MIKSIVEFHGNTTFHSNTVDSVGGALYLLSSSQILLHTNAHLEFINNTGRQVTYKAYYFKDAYVLSIAVCTIL